MSATLFAHRPPVDLAAYVRPRWSVGVGRGCGCTSDDLAAVVMAELGMAHAAAMHADPTREWTSGDWRAHIAEEHEVLFPALLAVGRGEPTVAQIVARLEADHAVYLERLDAGLELPRGAEPYSVDAHGNIEDGLVRQYASALRGGARVGGMIGGGTASKSAALEVAPAAASSRASLWPWAVGGALGVGAWFAGLGPLGIALSTIGGAGSAVVVQRAAAPRPAPPPPLMYEGPPPPPFTDPATYFAKIAEETKAIQKLRSDRDAETDARVKKWKEDAEYIPYVGPFASAFIDLGAWLGKKLGSNYAEQNSQEDLDQAATWIAEMLSRGFVPPMPRFNEKDGARNYNQGIAKTLEDLGYMADEAGDAVRTMGLMTIARAGHPSIARAVTDAARGNGSLGIGSLKATMGPEFVAAGVASAVYGVPYDELVDVARSVKDSDRYSASYYRTLLNNVADRFVATMRYASDKHYGVKS